MSKTKNRGQADKHTNNKNVIPLGDRVLVKPLTEDKRTESGIIIPDTVNKERPEKGRVVSVGEGKMTDDGRLIKPKVKAGDIVLFSKYGHDEIKIEDEDYLIVSESNILAIIK